MRRPLRLTALALAAALTVSVPFAPAAVAAADRDGATANSYWLAGELTADGTLENPNGGSLPDHGLMIDVLFALHASGNKELAAPVVSYLEQHATDYYTWDGLVPGAGYEDVIVGGAAAKMLVAAEAAGKNPRSFGGHDLVAETQGAIMRSGPDKGRISDYSKNPDLADSVSNNANMFGQALGVIGLAAVGENDRLAIDTMLTQQCSEGYFRIFFGYIPTEEEGEHVTPNGYKVSTCDEGKAHDQSAPDGDATGLALSALVAARHAGVQGLDAAIDKTVSWLVANQKSDGGWGGGVGTEGPNTNSTGLIVQALVDAGGASDAVDRGTKYLASAQVKGGDVDTALGKDLGAIAYTPEAYRSARKDGIGGRDTWVRAGAQASLGLGQVGFYDLARGDVPPPGKKPGEQPPGKPPGKPGKPGKPGNPDDEKSASGKKLPKVSDKAGAKPPPPGSSGGTVVVPQRPQAERGSATAAGTLGRYLAKRLVDGDHVEVAQGGSTYVDYDLTADVVFALRTLDEQPQAVAKASRFLLHRGSVRAYGYGKPYEKGAAAYAEPLAKLQLAGRFLVRDKDQAPKSLPTTLDELKADLAGLDADGTFTDTGEFADDSTSTERHAWATLATVAAGSDGAAEVAALTEGRCADGTFPKELAAGCKAGDPAATAAAVQALNATARSQSKPLDRAPDGWPRERSAALVDAVRVVSGLLDDTGVVRDGKRIDVGLTSRVAAARQVAGLDASSAATQLRRQLGRDGGMPADQGKPAHFGTSVAAAEGVAGRSWISAAGSPVSSAVHLPLADGAGPDIAPAAAEAPSGDGLPGWLIGVLGGVAFVLAVALGFCLRHLTSRSSSRKAVTS